MQTVFQFCLPNTIPEYDSLKTLSVSSDVSQLIIAIATSISWLCAGLDFGGVSFERSVATAAGLVILLGIPSAKCMEVEDSYFRVLTIINDECFGNE